MTIADQVGCAVTDRFWTSSLMCSTTRVTLHWTSPRLPQNALCLPESHSECHQLSWSALYTDWSFPFPVAEVYLLLVTCVRLSTVRCLSPDINYHWRVLPQVSFSLRQRFCSNKTHLLSRQKYACCDKTFVATSLPLSWQTQNTSFVMTKVCLSQQTCVCVTNICGDRSFVVSKVLSRQAYFCRDRRHVLSVCHDKMFAASKIILVAAPASDNK